MQLFLFLNDLAGRWPLLDEAARLFYVGALPVLGTLVGAQLLLLPRSFGGASRSKTALALVLALVLGALLVGGSEWLASAWHLGNLSPRPWMTRRVQWLVAEPQDTSFPSLEVLFAFALATASLLLNHKIGFGSVVLALVFALTRMFCGNNYFADVVVGALLGTGLLLLCAAMVRRHVSLRSRARALCVGSVLVGGTLAGVYAFAMTTPRFAGKLGFPAASAATATQAATANSATANSAARSAPTLFGEGEDASSTDDESRAAQVALAKRSSLFLPDVEAYLRGKLAPLARPLTLLDVEVAPVKAGTTSFRCAAVRFEVATSMPDARRQVARCAGRLTRATFALDSHMQNVDIICVSRDEGRNLDNSMMVFPGGEVPVFTASVQRKNVVLKAPAWLNAPGLDGGLWLRARSRLYINDRALPASLVPPPPLATPTASPAPSRRAAPTTSPAPFRTLAPTRTTAPKSLSAAPRTRTAAPAAAAPFLSPPRQATRQPKAAPPGPRQLLPSARPSLPARPVAARPAATRLAATRLAAPFKPEATASASAASLSHRLTPLVRRPANGHPGAPVSP